MSDPFRLIAAALGSEADARRVLAALEEGGFVCAPIKPTQEMLDAAYWSALAEDAAGVWTDMLEAVKR